jgi:hypothetical protein
VVFWLAWWLAYSLFFFIPVHELKGWGLSRISDTATFKDARQIGLGLYILKTSIFNSLLAVILPQAILIYVLLYWLLPNYFYRKKNPFVTVVVLVIVLVIYRFVAIQFMWFAGAGNYVFGLPYPMPTFKYVNTAPGFTSLRQQLGSLPVLIGIAVMITLIKRWWLESQETEQVAREKTKAELQLLKAQVHPHFLFNTLNNIYFFIVSGSAKAPEMITKLSGLLHYILSECNQPVVSLEKEIKMIRDYVSLEKIRYEDDMNMSVELPDNCSNKMIAPLLLIPFIENSFKHGASKVLAHPYVKLRMTIENNIVHFFISNSRPEFQDSLTTKTVMPNPSAGQAGRQGNIGLKNVKKRLQLLYPSDHELNIIEKPGSFSIYLKIRLTDITSSSGTNEALKHLSEYAVA